MQTVMKKNYFLIFSLQLFVLLLCWAACNAPKNKEGKLNENFAIADSLFAPTGDAELDSLLQLVAVAKQDTTLVKLYLDIGDMYQNSDFEKAKYYYTKMGNLSEKLGWSVGMIWYAASYYFIQLREGELDSALMVLQKGLDIAIKENDEMWMISLKGNMGNVYFEKRWYNTALEYYMEILPILEKKEGHKRKLAYLYSHIGAVYTYLNIHEKAIEYMEKSVALYNKNPYNLGNLANAYLYLQEYEKANQYYEEALQISKDQNNLYLIHKIYDNLGYNALLANELKKAEKYANYGLETGRIIGNIPIITEYGVLGKVELLKGNYALSEKYIKEALHFAKELEQPEDEIFCYLVLSELAIAQKKYNENMLYWNERILVENKKVKEASIVAAEEMAVKYETAKKELEIEKQKSIIAKQNLYRWLLVGGIALSALFLALLWYLLRLRTRRNNILAEMNATKDKFFNIISHDIKNPALAQRDAIQQILNNVSGWNSETLAQYLHELLKSADGEVELVYNLLNWAQVQTGRMAFMPAPCDLAAILRHEITLIQEMAKNKEITFISQIQDNVMVTADRNMIATVVRNLLTNAVKFTPTGGTVTLKISGTDESRGQKSSTPPETGYIISVSDTGIGMTENQIRNLFRLDSAHSSRGTANESGSGLGLIVCKDLLEKHGSVLHIESEEGKGSRFWFELK
jgi:signal transduction histidine kinase